MPKLPPFDAPAVVAAAADVAAGRTLERGEQAGLARAICGELAARYPGRSIELRVPPFAAVQLGLDEAGAHRRGTPPNVVELDGATLIRLAAGTLTWAEARAAHLVRASGVRSDLATLFPLTAPTTAHRQGTHSLPTGSAARVKRSTDEDR